MMCYWYCVEKTVIIIESKNFTEAVFNAISEFVANSRKDYQMRRAIYGLLAMLEEPAKLPLVIYI